jgi:hypothetical protein
MALGSVGVLEALGPLGWGVVYQSKRKYNNQTSMAGLSAKGTVSLPHSNDLNTQPWGSHRPNRIIKKFHSISFGLILTSHRSRGRCKCPARKTCPGTGYLHYRHHMMHIDPYLAVDSPRRTCAQLPPLCRAELLLRRVVWELDWLRAPFGSDKYEKDLQRRR